jgi:hypothetical protein
MNNIENYWLKSATLAGEVKEYFVDKCYII